MWDFGLLKFAYRSLFHIRQFVVTSVYLATQPHHLAVQIKVNKRTRGTCYVIPQILGDFEFGLFCKYRAGEQNVEDGSAKIRITVFSKACLN